MAKYAIVESFVSVGSVAKFDVTYSWVLTLLLLLALVTRYPIIT